MVEMTFIGHSCFTLSDGENLVLIDPFVDQNPVATVNNDSLNPNTILVTHGHGDHCVDAIPIARRTGAPLIACAELADYFGSHEGVDSIGANHGGTIEFTGGSVKFTPAWHSSSIHEDGKLVAANVPAGLVVRFGGLTFYFAGDTALFSDMRLIGEEGIDVAILPIGDKYTMGQADAVKAVKFLQPRFVVPCHYNTFPAIAQDGPAFAANVARQTNAKGRILEPGESTTFDQTAKSRVL